MEKQMTLIEVVELVGLIGAMPVHLVITFWVLGKLNTRGITTAEVKEPIMAKQFILQVYGWVGDGPCPVADQYVERFDPKADARNGAQCMWFTPDIAKAKSLTGSMTRPNTGG